MLRVSTARARPGMRLGRDVYDATGRLVLARGTRLTEESVTLLGRAGSSQIFIVDPRVGDIPVSALFPDELEAKAMRALHTLLVRKEGVTEGVGPADLLDVQTALRQMVDQLFPVPLGDPDLCNRGSTPYRTIPTGVGRRYTGICTRRIPSSTICARRTTPMATY